MGCDELIERVQSRLGVKLGEHHGGWAGDAGGGLLPRALFAAPSAMIDGKLVGRLDSKKLDRGAAEADR